MATVESYNLQLVPGGLPLVIHVSQYDTDREYQFSLYYESAEYEYSSDITDAVIEATKPDYTIVVDTATYNSDGTVSYTPVAELFQMAGDVYAKVRLVTSSGKTMASGSVIFAVDAAGIKTYARLSQSNIDVLEETIGSITSAAEIASDAAAAATLSESWAVGGTDTRDGEDTDNSKYYASQASSYASAASTSKTSAANSASSASTSASSASSSATAAASSATTAKTNATSAATSANNAATSEANAADAATLAESWAVGGTGSRSGEDTNNSAYYAAQAESAAESAKAAVDSVESLVTGVYSFNSRTGAVDPETGDYSAEMVTYDGASSGLTATTVQDAIDEIAGSSGSGSTYSYDADTETLTIMTEG